MVPLRLQIRLALRLQDRYFIRAQRRQAVRQAALDRLVNVVTSLEPMHRSLRWARAHGLSFICGEREARYLDRVLYAIGVAKETEEALEPEIPQVPDLASLLAELRQLQQEFGDLEIRRPEHCLRVITSRIMLEDVDLGPFAIDLDWRRLDQDMGHDGFHIVALDPNPAGDESNVTHPHVNDEHLCPGDAADAIRLALDEGRLADAFCLVRGILMNYNSASPYVPLDNWSGTSCPSCGERMTEDDRNCCSCCDEDVCDDCVESCESCGSAYCADCMKVCAVCSEAFCRDCTKPSAHSRRLCCSNCLVSCVVCVQRIAEDETCCPPVSSDVPDPTNPSSLVLEDSHESNALALAS